MKRILIALITLTLILSGCGIKPEETKEEATAKKSNGVWLSYTEINSMLASSLGFKGEFSLLLDNMRALGLDTLYFHIRSHCDSVVKSDYFPQTEGSKTVDFDILEYVLSACHGEGIRVFGWINPYRVAVNKTLSELEELHPVRQMTKTDIIEYNGGVYLNPASQKARTLVLNGIRELTEKYPIDGIHFDDYFYPSDDPEIDKASYSAYSEATEKPLSLDAWRRANVDILIADCKAYLDTLEERVVFSISPAADIEKNFNTYYADVKGWIQGGYVDEVIPQLYFGFNHTDPDFDFDRLLNRWLEICENKSVALKIGLAPYKAGTKSETDGSEWQDNDDILAEQTRLCLENKSITGVIYFSYTYLFSENKANVTQLENLKEVIN